MIDLNKIVITIEPSDDGDGWNVEAVSILSQGDPDVSTELAGWHWTGWAETPKRAAEYAVSEWEFKRTHP